MITPQLREAMATEYRSGATISKLSVSYEIGQATVRSILAEMGVEIRTRGGGLPRAQKKNGDLGSDARARKMAKLYKNGRTLQEIGDEFDLSRERVRQILRNHNVKSLGRRTKPADTVPLTDEEKKIAARYDSGVSPSEILMDNPHLKYTNIHSILRRAGVPLKEKGYFIRRPDYEQIMSGILADYRSGMGTGEIAEKYGLCGKTEIYKFLSRGGIEVRQGQEKG